MGMIGNGTRSIRVSRAKAYQGKCLLDRGANGNICGGDVRSISFSDRTLNVTGIDEHEHEMRNLKIGTFGGVVSTQRGDVIAIFNQSAYHPGGKSILSCLQVEDNGITVQRTSVHEDQAIHKRGIPSPQSCSVHKRYTMGSLKI